jgi:hypothetical protein
VVEPADHDLVAAPPVLAQRPGHPVGQRGHVRAEDDAGRDGAHQVGDGGPRAGDQLLGAGGGGEHPTAVGDRHPHGLGHRAHHGLRHQRPTGAVGVHQAVGEPREQPADARHVQLPRPRRHGGSVVSLPGSPAGASDAAGRPAARCADRGRMGA